MITIVKWKITREKWRGWKIDLEGKVVSRSMCPYSTVWRFLRNVVSFPGYRYRCRHRDDRRCNGHCIEISRPRGVLANRSITSLPLSDNCVNRFFFQPPPSLSQQKRNSIFRASSIESNYEQYIPPSEHHSSKSYLSYLTKSTQTVKFFIYFFHL